MRTISVVARSLAAAALAGVLSQSVFAAEDDDFDYDTTKDLYDVCSVDVGAAEYIPAVFGCRAFIEAAVQYHDAVTDRKNLKRLICYSDAATIAESRRVFVAWVEKHAGDRELMSEMPVVGLVRALADHFPCN